MNEQKRSTSKRSYILRHIVIALGLFALFAVIAGVFLFPAASSDPTIPGPPVHATPVELIRIVDGDTIVIRMGDGRQETVRYVGLDAPEYDVRSGAGQAFGKEALDANERWLGSGPLTVALDREHRDRYDRLLAYVYSGTEFVNARLVQDGLAQVLVIPPNEKHLELLLRLQLEALEAERGLWGEAKANIVDWQDAAAHIDEAATIEGVITRTHKDAESGITFLNFSSNIRQHFTVIISEVYGERFPNPPESNYSGHRVRVTGLVQSFQGQPQIAVQIPEQIEVLD